MIKKNNTNLLIPLQYKIELANLAASCFHFTLRGQSHSDAAEFPHPLFSLFASFNSAYDRFNMRGLIENALCLHFCFVVAPTCPQNQVSSVAGPDEAAGMCALACPRCWAAQLWLCPCPGDTGSTCGCSSDPGRML